MTIPGWHRRALALSLAATCTAVLSAQQPTFKAETSLVEVDAVVTDGQGDVVQSLTKDDFAKSRSAW